MAGMAENGWKWLKCLKIARNGWIWLEIAENDWNGRKWPKIAGIAGKAGKGWHS